MLIGKYFAWLITEISDYHTNFKELSLTCNYQPWKPSTNNKQGKMSHNDEKLKFLKEPTAYNLSLLLQRLINFEIKVRLLVALHWYDSKIVHSTPVHSISFTNLSHKWSLSSGNTAQFPIDQHFRMVSCQHNPCSSRSFGVRWHSSWCIWLDCCLSRKSSLPRACH